MILSIPVSAAQSYQTYTYSIDGKVLYSPDAYTPQKNVNSTTMNLGELAMKGPKDIVVDKEQNVFVADSGNNRILCLDRYYNLRFVIKDFVNDKGVADFLENPQGLFVNEQHIYVCDYNKARIVRFNLADGSFHSIIDAPQSELFGDNSNYFPAAMAVDQYGRMFIVSKETNEGIIVMTQKGEFTGFIGAQKSVTSVWDQIWRRFQSKEQRKNSETTSSATRLSSGLLMH
jgi:sugar lactone lactonase YvrE